MAKEIKKGERDKEGQKKPTDIVSEIGRGRSDDVKTSRKGLRGKKYKEGKNFLSSLVKYKLKSKDERKGIVIKIC